MVAPQSTQQGPCVNSDPDIAGIGVRLAVFVQTFLTFFPPALAITDGIITATEAKRMFRLSIQNLVLAGSLVLVAIIKLTQGDLSAYHALTIIQMAWALEGPLLLSYPLVDYVFKARFKGSRSVDFLAKSSMTVYLPLFRFFHGSFALVVWAMVTTGKGLLKCIDETFLLPGIKVYIREPAVQGLFISLSAFRVVEGLFTLLQGFKHGSGHKDAGKASGERDGEEVHRGVVMARLSVAAALWGWLFVFSWKLGEESQKAKLVTPGEISWGFGQIIPLCMLAFQVREVFRAFWVWMHPPAAESDPTTKKGDNAKPLQEPEQRPDVHSPLKQDVTAEADRGRSTAIAIEHEKGTARTILDSFDSGSYDDLDLPTWQGGLRSRGPMSSRTVRRVDPELGVPHTGPMPPPAPIKVPKLAKLSAERPAEPIASTSSSGQQMDYGTK